MDLQIRNKVALVGGASRGLGKATALQLAQEGCDIIAYARNAKRLEQTANEIRVLGSNVQTYCLDMAQQSCLKQLQQCIAQHQPQILVNVPGGPPPSPAHAIDHTLWRQQADTLLFATIAMCDSAVVHMRSRSWGRIITITSSGVIEPIAHLAISNTLRSGFTAWSKTLATQLAKDGITINTVVPGRIDTERVAELDATLAQKKHMDITQVRQQSIQNIPAGRYGKPHEFAATVAFLASEQAGYITGSQIRVDGGMIRSV